MDRNNDRITSSQLFSVLTGTILGIGVLSLPRSLAKASEADSLIVVLLGGAIVFLITLLIMLIYQN